MIYLTAVCFDRSDTEHTAYVATPIGPYRPDETDALERGRAFLREAYKTEDIRTVEPCGRGGNDFMDVRSQVLAVVIKESERARLEHEEMMANAAVEALREDTSRWLGAYGLDPSPDDLDAVLEALGVNPGDV